MSKLDLTLCDKIATGLRTGPPEGLLYLIAALSQPYEYVDCVHEGHYDERAAAHHQAPCSLVRLSGVVHGTHLCMSDFKLHSPHVVLADSASAFFTVHGSSSVTLALNGIEHFLLST